MNLSILEEPELEFGGNARHIDIRFGIRDYGPFDMQSPRAPKRIQIGLIGTAETTEAASLWIEKCKLGIGRKESKQPNLFPAFPPISSSSSFCCLFETDRALIRNIAGGSISKLSAVADMNLRIESATQLFLSEMEVLCENAKPDVIVCAIPLELLELLSEERRSPGRMDLHHLLKARSMQLRIPIQLVLPGTYDESKAKNRSVQEHHGHFRMRRPERGTFSRLSTTRRVVPLETSTRPISACLLLRRHQFLRDPRSVAPDYEYGPGLQRIR